MCRNTKSLGNFDQSTVNIYNRRQIGMKSSQRGLTLIGIIFFLVGLAVSYFTFQSDMHIAAKALIFMFIGLPCLFQPFRY